MQKQIDAVRKARQNYEKLDEKLQETPRGTTTREKRKYRKGDIGFHHYAFELSSRKDVDALGAFLAKHGMDVVDPPGEYYGRSYYAVYFTDPDGMKLEGMVYKPPPKPRRAKKKK